MIGADQLIVNQFRAGKTPVVADKPLLLPMILEFIAESHHLASLGTVGFVHKLVLEFIAESHHLAAVGTVGLVHKVAGSQSSSTS